jgi:ATP-dependent helicase/DNAse subunit B
MPLANFENNAFFTQNSMEEALRYVNDLCATNPDSTASLAVRAAVGVVLNTAIATHKAELDALRAAAKPDPLTNTLADMMREIARSELESMDIFTKDQTKELVNDCVQDWVDDNLADKLEEWHSENIDIDNEIEKYLRNNDLDFVAEQVTRYFGNNTFSLEPR